MLKKYMLEFGELYIIPEPLTKNRTFQSVRWKQIAMSDTIESLLPHLEPFMRIIDNSTLEIVRKHKTQR